MAVYLVATVMGFDPARGSLGAMLAHGLRASNCWFWVVAVLGAGRRFLIASHRVLHYASEASYPFYILHQTVIVAVGYYVVQVDGPVALEFLLIMAAAAALTLAIYELIVRRLPLLRVVFGMKVGRGARVTPAEARADRGCGLMLPRLRWLRAATGGSPGGAAPFSAQEQDG